MFSCKGCTSADPTSDTVKPDFSKIQAEKDATERRKAEGEAAQSRKMEEAESQRKAEAQRLRAEAEATTLAERVAERERQVAAEQRRREEEEMENQRQQEQMEQERQLAAQEAERKKREAEEQQQRQQEAEDKENRGRLDAWLQQEKFVDVNHKRKSLIKSKYPLHAAVKKQDADMVQLLLRYNADPTLKDSNSQTPKQLAEKSNKDGSLQRILQALPWSFEPMESVSLS